MPIYMYRCGECSQTCEALQHSNDAPLLECPHCHAQALHKIIAPVGVIFKGHGFYKTDNASGSIHDDYRHEHGDASSTQENSDSSTGEKATRDGASNEGASKDSAVKDSAAKDGAKASATESKKSNSAPASAVAAPAAKS